jgi:hypothetical protein
MYTFVFSVKPGSRSALRGPKTLNTVYLCFDVGTVAVQMRELVI